MKLAAVGAAGLLAIGGAAATVVGTGGIAAAAGPVGPGGGSQSGPGGPGGAPGFGGPGGGRQWGPGGGPGGAGGPHGRGGPGRGVMGTVGSGGVNGSSFTVQGPGGQTYTVTVGSSTSYDFGPGLPGTLTDVQAGERVAVGGSVSGSDVTATAVHMLLPRDQGQVTGVSGNDVSIQERDGRTATLQLSTAPGVQTGQEVVAAGKWQQDTLVAQAFAVVPPHLDGSVTAVSGDTATVQTRTGSMTLQWTASTVFRSGPNGTASAKAVVVGAHIHAVGQQSGSTFDATQIDVMPARPAPPQGAPQSPSGS